LARPLRFVSLAVNSKRLSRASQGRGIITPPTSPAKTTIVTGIVRRRLFMLRTGWPTLRLNHTIHPSATEVHSQPRWAIEGSFGGFDLHRPGSGGLRDGGGGGVVLVAGSFPRPLVAHQAAACVHTVQRPFALAARTAAKPVMLNSPASWSSRARSTCRSPTWSRFPAFIRCGINSRFAMTLSSSGATDRGMMWSTEGG